MLQQRKTGVYYFCELNRFQSSIKTCAHTHTHTPLGVLLNIRSDAKNKNTLLLSISLWQCRRRIYSFPNKRVSELLRIVNML